MKKISTLLALSFILLASVSCKREAGVKEGTVSGDTIAKKAETHKIVSLNGAVTEIVAALGHEKEIVGVDVTSTYPETLKKTAKELGHVAHGVNIEAIMALQPTLVLGTEKDMTPDLLAKIKASGVKYKIFKQDFSVDGAKKLIADVAAELNHKDFKALQDEIDAGFVGVKQFKLQPKVLFIYARGANMLMVSGTGTPIDAMIQLAGGRNAVNGFSDFKPLTPEAVITANPDVILLFDSGAQSVDGSDGVLKLPGVAKTNAGKNKKIVTMDGGLLTNFGPRTGEAAKALNVLLAKDAK